MSDIKTDEITVADEIFKLMLKAFAWKNERFNNKVGGNLWRFKACRKKIFILFCIDYKKRCTLSELEKILVENRSTVSVAVSKLYYEGLVSKNQPGKEDDGRRVYFKLTKKGRAFLNNFISEFKKEIGTLYSGLTDEKKQYLVNAIESLNSLL